MSMNNVWLSQLFKNDGKVLDTYLPYRIRNNKDYIFGFVCFSIEDEALRAMKRNPSLVIKDRKLLINKEKFHEKSKPTKPLQQYEKMRSQYCASWRPSLRDNRSYKEVIDSTSIEEIDIPKDIPLEKGLRISYLCYFRDGVSIHQSVMELEN